MTSSNSSINLESLSERISIVEAEDFFPVGVGISASSIRQLGNEGKLPCWVFLGTWFLVSGESVKFNTWIRLRPGSMYRSVKLTDQGKVEDVSREYFELSGEYQTDKGESLHLATGMLFKVDDIFVSTRDLLELLGLSAARGAKPRIRKRKLRAFHEQRRRRNLAALLRVAHGSGLHNDQGHIEPQKLIDRYLALDEQELKQLKLRINDRLRKSTLRVIISSNWSKFSK